MNLLLLLSALLSALTGVNASARAPQASTEVAATAIRATAIAPRQQARRPVVGLPTLAISAAAPVARSLALPAIEPLYAARRRE